MVTAFQNCGQTGMQSSKAPEASNITPEKSLQDIRTLIDTLNQEDLTCSQDSDCESMPIGWRACGGPSEYIAASVIAPQHAQLASLAEFYRQKVNAQLIAQSAVGTCDFLMPPEVHCVSNKCR